MALTTRCPHCGTAFKVVADQLRVRNGLVRCGVCTRVFDGYEAIVDEEMPTLAPPSTAAPTPTPTPTPTPPPPPTPPAPAAAPAPATHPAPPWDTRPAPPVPYPSPAPARDDISDAHLWTREPTLPGRAPTSRDAGISTSKPIPTPESRPTPTPTSAAGRDDISDAHLWANEPTLPAQPPAVLRGRSDTWRQEPTFISRDAPEDDDEPLDDDDDVGVASSGAQPVDDPQVIRHRRPIYVDPVDDQYDDDLHGHPVEEDGRLEPDDHAVPRDGVYIYPARDHRADDEEETGNFPYIPVRGDARTRYDDDVDTGMAPPVFMDESRLRRAALVRRLWAAGCLLALCVLGLQWVYVYRSAVASTVPALRPALQAACGALGCEVGYARRLERISITASSLQPPAGAAAADDGTTRLVLSVTLRNRYDKPQPWPALVLELTDLSDTVVVRKVLRPEDYLPADAGNVFPAGGEQSLSIPLRVAGAQVNGYQLDKFFP